MRHPSSLTIELSLTETPAVKSVTGRPAESTGAKDRSCWRITKHELQLASTAHVADGSAAHDDLRDQRAERGTERGVAGARARHDTTAGYRDGCTGRPLKTDARAGQHVSRRVEHVHRHLHRRHVVYHDWVSQARDEARRRPLATDP